MPILWLRVSQADLQKALHWSNGDEIGTTDHFRNILRVVVHHAGKHIGVRAIGAQQHRVLLGKAAFLHTEIAILPKTYSGGAQIQAPSPRLRRGPLAAVAGRLQKALAATAAGISKAGGTKLCKGGVVVCLTSRLVANGAVPVQAKHS